MTGGRGELAVPEPVVEGERVTIRLAGAGLNHDVHYSIAGLAPPNLDFVLPAALVPAMRVAGALRLPGPVSPRLLAAAPVLQGIYRTWDDAFGPVRLHAHAREVGRSAGGRGTAVFFSGGVDSLHTLLRNADRITHLIFVRGFDFFRRHPAVAAPATAAARRVAAELGKELVEVDTDVHVLTDPLMKWEHYMVPAMATVALLLADRFERVLIASEHSYADLVPWGGTPYSDPLWSTEQLEIEHDGAEVKRIDKVAEIARSDLAMDVLRVCWENTGDAYNCGACEKCLRTMIALEVAGALERCRTLPSAIDPDAVAALELQDENDLAFVRQNRTALERAGGYDELVAALRESEARATTAPSPRPAQPAPAVR